jgi:hypothetical protein
MKLSHSLPTSPTLKQRRDAVLDNIHSAQNTYEARAVRYNRYFDIKQKALYLGTAVLVAAGAMTAIYEMNSGPDFLANKDPYILQPGESISEVAAEICHSNNVDAAVAFITKESHINQADVSSIPSFTLLTVPLAKSC